VNKGNTAIASSFNKGLELLAEGKEVEAYDVYYQAMRKACRSGNHRAIPEGTEDLRDLVAKRSIQLDRGFPFLELLGRDFDLLRLLVSSKHWGQELNPEFLKRFASKARGSRKRI
jgi:hypothetical protein